MGLGEIRLGEMGLGEMGQNHPTALTCHHLGLIGMRTLQGTENLVNFTRFTWAAFSCAGASRRLAGDALNCVHF